MNIAFIGLGNMGSGMAANQAKAGRTVHAFDLSATALERARTAGCLPAASAAEAVWARICRDGHGGTATYYVRLYRWIMRPVLRVFLRLACAPGGSRSPTATHNVLDRRLSPQCRPPCTPPPQCGGA